MKKYIKSILLTLLSTYLLAQENTVEPFLPQLFYQFPNIRDVAISTLEDEIYFSVQSYSDEISLIAYSKKLGNSWSSPEIVSFSGKYFDIEPFLSLDGLQLYFASNRPLNENNDAPKDFDIWYVQRKDKNSEWSSPINLGNPINTDKNEFYPTLAKNKNLYFTSDRLGSLGKDDIFFSIWENGKYLNPVTLGDSINTEGYEFNSFIAPDESYIIFSGYQRKDGYGSGDLYISYRISSGNWIKAINLGEEINSDRMDYCPFVDINSNLLYFTSKRTNVNKNQKQYSSMQEFFSEVTKYENGRSRIYNTSFKKHLEFIDKKLDRNK